MEDDDRIARLLSRALADEGYALQRAATGPEGLAAAMSGSFPLVILDLMLPGMDGKEVLRRLLQAHPGQRVLVLSAVPEISTRVACFEEGAVDFVGKPFALAELMARIRSRLRQPVAETLTIGPVRLDLRLQQLEVLERRATSLSYREFVLLRHLMQRAGKTCSRAELLQEVWQLAFDPGSNVVDVYVGRLRAKLDSPDRIVAVRNVGYRFLPE